MTNNHQPRTSPTTKQPETPPAKSTEAASAKQPEAPPAKSTEATALVPVRVLKPHVIFNSLNRGEVTALAQADASRLERSGHVSPLTGEELSQLRERKAELKQQKR